MIEYIGIGIGFVLLSIMISGGIACSVIERREYNKGICKCGKGWFEHRDTDSQGGSMWVCNACGKTIWTSWV